MALDFWNFNYQISNIPKVTPKKKDEELVTKMFPWFTDKQVKQLYKDTALVPAEKRQEAQQEIYRYILPQLKAEEEKTKRTIVKNDLYNDTLNEKSPQKRAVQESAIKVADFADAVRSKYWQLADSDDEIVKKVVEKTPNGRMLFQKYLNEWDEEIFYQAGIKEREEKLDENLLTDLWIGVWWTIWAIAWSYWIGKATENIGESIYWLTLPPWVDEARAIQKNKAWLWPKPRTTVETAIDKNIMWTRSMIGTQAEKEANKIFTKTVNPMLEKATTKTNVQWLIDELWTEIEKFAKWDPDKLAEYNDALIEMKKSFWDKKFSELSQKELHELKSWLQGRTPQKFFKGKEITNAYQELRAKLATKLTKNLHTNLTQEFWENTAKLYKDYANLQWLKEVWVKSRSAAWLKWWFGWFWSTIAQELATPATTVWGKALVSAGKLLQKPAELTLKWIKAIAKAWKGILSADPTGILWNIIENEIYTKDLKWQQFPIRHQMILWWMNKEEATKKAKQFPSIWKSTDLVTYL